MYLTILYFLFIYFLFSKAFGKYSKSSRNTDSGFLEHTIMKLILSWANWYKQQLSS